MSIHQRIRHLQKIIQSDHPLEILAVSKGQSVQAIEEAYEAGIRHFAENYWQEAELKIGELKVYPIVWHFIGAMQSNKIREIATHFDWAHTVDSEKKALLLGKHRSSQMPPLNICIQVNLDEEPDKAGVLVEDAENLALAIHKIPGLKLRGLMAIPSIQNDPETQFLSFKRLSDLQKNINSQGIVYLDILSMGMSNDFQAAIRAGSNMLRIGRAIFGERT